MTFHIITLFPRAFDSYLGESIVARAIEDKKIKIKFYDPKDFAKLTARQEGGRVKRVDDRPFGGGPGMVLRPLPVINAIAAAISKSKGRNKNKSAKIIFLSPGGKQFSNKYADGLAAKYSDIILVSGRYEGIDTRVKKIFKMEEISVGPFVLTGGELPAMILIDVISRRIPGVLGSFKSLEESRSASSDVYTRPEEFTFKGRTYGVPKVLLSGNHAKIEKWRAK